MPRSPTPVSPPPGDVAIPRRVGGRLWLDFVNSGGGRVDLIHQFEHFVRWLEGHGALDAERAAGIRRRASDQPAGAAAALLDARRVRAALRALAERGTYDADARAHALLEINRVIGRSFVTRRIEAQGSGYARAFASSGDAFAALLIPIADSAADTLVLDELPRVRSCAAAGCGRVFLDETRGGTRRWCEMRRCGNRAKARRWRAGP